jgi:hypothetical protein
MYRLIEFKIMTEIKNFTPHKLRFYAQIDDVDVIALEIESDGIVRAKQNPYVQETFISRGTFGIPVMAKTSFGEPDFIPEEKENTIYVVSQIAAQSIKTYYPERNDFYIVAETVRNSEGEIIGCRSLTKL